MNELKYSPGRKARMDRLTSRNKLGLAYLINVKPDEQEVESPYPNTLRCILDCFNRLAEYEDTGLSPAEVAELAQAKADGRVVVLPVSVGDTVHVDKGVTVKSAEGWRTKRILFVGKVVSFRKNGNGVFLKIRFSFMEGSKSYMRSYAVSAIGKTIFLTRGEAEKALRERENNV